MAREVPLVVVTDSAGGELEQWVNRGRDMGPTPPPRGPGRYTPDIDKEIVLFLLISCCDMGQGSYIIMYS